MLAEDQGALSWWRNVSTPVRICGEELEGVYSVALTSDAIFIYCMATQAWFGAMYSLVSYLFLQSDGIDITYENTG